MRCCPRRAARRESPLLAELFRAAPSSVSVLDVPPATLISRAGDVRDESFIVLRGTLDVDGIEQLGAGSSVGETAFLSGDVRACDVRTIGGRGGALLLVMSRVGFLKAMSKVPHVAVQLLWNIATQLSRKFALRNARLRQTVVALEEAHKKVQRHEEIAELKAAAKNLRSLFVGASGSSATSVAASASATNATSAALTRRDIPSSPSWEAVFTEGLESFRRLERGDDGSGRLACARRAISASPSLGDLVPAAVARSMSKSRSSGEPDGGGPGGAGKIKASHTSAVLPTRLSELSEVAEASRKSRIPSSKTLDGLGKVRE